MKVQFSDHLLGALFYTLEYTENQVKWLKRTMKENEKICYLDTNKYRYTLGIMRTLAWSPYSPAVPGAQVRSQVQSPAKPYIPTHTHTHTHTHTQAHIYIYSLIYLATGGGSST